MLKTFYVSFGLGSILRNHHVAIEAYDEEIVRAWMRKQKLPWSNVYEVEPVETKRLNGKAEVLWYQDARHV